ncbi:hypothetical protein GIB67_016175 [Kingdonia uniflora]|uniref:MCAfunc domain-containing protein n=1 Tax=Kingdonia uniflora TaxID=39325 RepID=A0A7J7N9I5_9MAGN|nr:hypothetical protein GIB67_016175 [Kingdonia uniflora]
MKLKKDFLSILIMIHERLDYIEKDQREYTLDEEDRKVQTIILKPEPSNNDSVVLKKSISCSYPNLRYDEALQKENEKLQLELQRSQANMDVNQCEVIQHLLEVTESAANSVLETPLKNSKRVNLDNSDTNDDKKRNIDESYHKQSSTHNQPSRSTSSVSSGHAMLSSKESHRHEEWHSDLLGCCSEPSLCELSYILNIQIYSIGSLSTDDLGFKTFFYPCGTFSKIASVASNRHMSSAEACNELMAYSLIFSCCCYTCCVRRKLRKTLNITGGFCDDFLSHLMCCCCALVQEWREVEIRGVSGSAKTRTSPPPSQFMES